MFNPWPNLGVFIILRSMHCISATKPLNNTNPPGVRSSISPSTPHTHLIKVGLAYKARGNGRLHLELFSCHWTYPPPPQCSNTVVKQTKISKVSNSSYCRRADFFSWVDGVVSPGSLAMVCIYGVCVWGGCVMLKLPPRHPALHQSGAAIDVGNGSTMGKTRKRYKRQARGTSRGLPFKTRQLFTSHSLLSSLGVFWLAVFSLLQSFLNFTVRFRHQRFNQMCSFHKQLFWLGDFLCTQINYTACFGVFFLLFWNHHLYNTKYPRQVGEEWILFHVSLWGNISHVSKTAFPVHVTQR